MLFTPKVLIRDVGFVIRKVNCILMSSFIKRSNSVETVEVIVMLLGGGGGGAITIDMMEISSKSDVVSLSY